MVDKDPFGGGGLDANGIQVIKDGNIVDVISPDSIKNFETGQTAYRYTDNEGNTKYTNSIYDLPISIALNEKTGNIKITAPKAIMELPEFEQTYSFDALKEYSKAYKLNNDYKVPYTERNENGEETKTEITIPEFIAKVNESLTKENGFIDNLKKAERQREVYRSKYGDKVDNFSLTQLQQTLDFGGNFIYVPKFLLNGELSSLKNKVDENGRVSIEDFREAYYNRDNVGRQEIVSLLGQIDSSLRYGSWGDDTFEDGEENPMSTEEMSRALNLKNYIESFDPDAEWYQQVGDNINAFVTNALYGANRVFANIGNLGEAVVTLGHGHSVQNYINEMDESMKRWNEENMLVNDATSVLSFLGMIGGTIAGTWMTGKVANIGLDKLTNKLGSYAAEYAEGLEAIQNMGPSAQAALTAETMGSIMSQVENISVGAQIMLKMASVAEKMSYAYGVYKAYTETHRATGFAVEFLIDTIHDALLYDSVSLRQALEASDQDTRDFWLGQLADNGKWWMGMASAKILIKGAGKTSLGKTLNAYATRYLNKKIASIGDKKAAMKDRMAGGSLIQALEEKLQKAMEKGNTRSARRIANKIEQARWSEILRNARRDLGNIELDKKSIVSLTDESAKKFAESVNAVKAIENSIDNYNRNIYFKRQEMLGLQKDPATGKMIFINPDLGGANMRASDFYLRLSELGARHGLKAANGSLISQDMIDYMMGSYHRDILQAFVDARGAKAAQAASALEVVERNVANVSQRLPLEIKVYIDTNRGVYTNFYASLNDYGKAKGLVDVEKITSYENNKIWAENGYMPIRIERDVIGGRWISEDGTVHAILEQDLNHHRFIEEIDQHYVDPELVRQTRISNMARAEVNLNIQKAYSQLESATNVVRISGEDTKFAKEVLENKSTLEHSINVAKANFGETTPFDIAKSAKSSKRGGRDYKMATRTNAASQFSYNDTKQILINKGVITAEKPYLTSDLTIEGYDDWYSSQSDTVKKYLKQEYDKYGSEGFDGLLTAIDAGGDDFEAGLQRAYLMGDEDFLKSDLMKRAIENQKVGKDAFYDGVVKESAKKRLSALSDVDADKVVDTITNVIKRDIEGYVQVILDSPSAKKGIDALAKTSNGSALNARYYALKRLADEPEEALSSLYKQIDDSIDKKIMAGSVDEIKKATEELYTDIVTNELNDAANSLRTINSSLLNPEDAFEKATKLDAKIKKADEQIKSRSTDNNLIMYLDEQGREVYAETDPTFASLFNYRYRMDKGEASALAKFNAATSKLFRYGTTSVNLASFGNQLFRDTGNAIMVGGGWRTIKNCADDLVDVFGENIVEQIKRFDPSGYEIRQVKAIAEQTGQSIEAAAVSRELARGAAISPSTTERTLYKDFMRDAYRSDKDQLITKAQTELQKVVDKYNPEDLLNGRRENYLRNRVFANNYDEAYKNGYTMEQARTFAEFAMNNATTNFSRQLYHMQAIADSTPYFRAAINGTKSFWRMWSLDPVGISGRVMGGLILPTIYLTGASVADPENREIYKNIPEYQKKDSLIFVVNGSVISIPIPQEMSAIVAPFRQFVEYLYDANKNDFWELMMNDALGFSPVDLQGFSTIDMNTMISEPTLADRISRGFSRVFSQMAPVPIKSAYMLAFKVDPYTGKNINDPSYSIWNDEVGDVVTMDYTQNEFAKWFSKSFGGKFGISSALAEKVLSGLFGTTTTNILSDVAALCSGGWSEGLKETATNIGSQLGKPFSVDVYDQADYNWKLAVRQLTAEKNSILASEKMSVYNKQLVQEKDPEKRKEILAKRQDLVNDYQQKVVETVKRLQSVYGGEYDRTKFAATIQLLNFNSDPIYQSGSQYSSDIANENYWDGRDEAIHTMEQLGIVGTNDMSIFGYMVRDKEGNIVVRYSDPVAILDSSNQWSNASDIHLANIKAAVKEADLWTKKDAMKAQRDAIYNKKKLTSSDYNAISALEVNWNAEVMKTILPYVEEYSPEAVINNSKVMNYLESLIEVPSSYKRDKYGRYVTNKTLGEGSAKDAYIRSYIQNIFSVNNTGYAGGKDYSKNKGDK